MASGYLAPLVCGLLLVRGLELCLVARHRFSLTDGGMHFGTGER